MDATEGGQFWMPQPAPLVILNWEESQMPRLLVYFSFIFVLPGVTKDKYEYLIRSHVFLIVESPHCVLFSSSFERLAEILSLYNVFFLGCGHMLNSNLSVSNSQRERL